jgi:hypothetical protein
MIHTQLLQALGYKGACILLSADWHSNRHILKKNDYTLCGLQTCIQKKVMKDGRFTGYKPGSITEVYGFYGSGMCKTCLKSYLRHRLSPKGKFMLRKARALEWLRLHR